MLNHASTTECLSHLRVDELLNGELEDRAEIRAHLAACARCAARVIEHRRERATFAVPRKRRAPRRMLRALAGAAALAVAIGVWLALPRAEAVREKGKPILGFYWKRGEVVQRGGDGERLAPGDSLTFAVSSDAPAYLAIISVDGAHQVSVYYPAQPITAALAPGRDQLLPFSVRLDGVLGAERLYGVFCDLPAPVAPLAAAIARGDRPAGCRIDQLQIEKR